MFYYDPVITPQEMYSAPMSQHWRYEEDHHHFYADPTRRGQYNPYPARHPYVPKAPGHDNFKLTTNLGPLTHPVHQVKKITNKTRCMFFAKGRCRYGDRCRFSHPLKEKKEKPPMKGPVMGYVHLIPEFFGTELYGFACSIADHKIDDDNHAQGRFLPQHQHITVPKKVEIAQFRQLKERPEFEVEIIEAKVKTSKGRNGRERQSVRLYCKPVQELVDILFPDTSPPRWHFSVAYLIPNTELDMEVDEVFQNFVGRQIKISTATFSLRWEAFEEISFEKKTQAE